MRRTANASDRRGDGVVNPEGPELSTPYRSPFGGRSYYPTTLFKRRSSSVPRADGEPVATDTPLLGRYRQGEPERDRVRGVRNAGASSSDGRCVSDSVTVVSPDQLGRGSRVVPALRPGVVGVAGEGGGSLRDAPAEQTGPGQQATQVKRRVALSCPRH
ncbi:hypothetical protein LSM04_007136 [Trypanosoma melophagium]|uniref:uncharacterized protein n=1 Tax=Trypanosoma melophagium TaxID=715481 RepID=UPI00351A6BD7|nr:hypothetical protein LSM04_007136 [Trypanosoma melophagium]